MFRLNGQYISYKVLVLATIECGLLLTSIWMAAWIRLGRASDTALYLSAPGTETRVALAIGICLACFYYGHLYDLQVVSRKVELVIRLIQTMGTASLILAILYYAFPGLMFAKGVFALACLIAPLLLITGRLIVDASGQIFRPEQRILLAGTGEIALLLVEEIRKHPELNFNLVGFAREADSTVEANCGPIIGNINSIEQIVRDRAVERVVLGLAERRGCMPVDKLLRVRLSGIPVEDAHALYEKLSGRILLNQLNPSQLIMGEGFSKTLFQRFAKRLQDVVISFTGLILTSPLMVLVAAAIWLESGRPIFFRQKRIGLHGKRFEILKFRSMRQQKQNDRASWAVSGDPRITKVGKIIRRFRIDEIPQFLNVLRGDMSLVGPRPEQPELVCVLEEQIPYYVERHSVRPGITGWAQVRSGYSSTIEAARTKLEYDLFYIKHLSVVFDAMIIFRTAQVVCTGSGAV